MEKLLQPHPLALLFPPLPADDFRALANDIKANGLHYPITRYEGMILDGVHRYNACITENVNPAFEDFDGDDPLAFVKSRNYNRRQLSTADRKKIAKALLEQTPSRSSNSIAKDVGISDHTVEKIRQEVESAPADGNSQNVNKDEQVPGEADAQEPDPRPLFFSPAVPAPAPVRTERSGRKARGRKPGQKRAGASARVQEPKTKETPARLRDEWVDDTSKRLMSDTFGALESIALIVSDLWGVIDWKCTEYQRKELLKKFAHGCGFDVTQWLDTLRGSGAV
jgi:ParB-like chromosome segregation protein Spo0J